LFWQKKKKKKKKKGRKKMSQNKEEKSLLSEKDLYQQAYLQASIDLMYFIMYNPKGKRYLAPQNPGELCRHCGREGLVVNFALPANPVCESGKCATGTKFMVCHFCFDAKVKKMIKETVPVPEEQKTLTIPEGQTSCTISKHWHNPIIRHILNTYVPLNKLKVENINEHLENLKAMNQQEQEELVYKLITNLTSRKLTNVYERSAFLLLQNLRVIT
jgi:hypothetical protein